MRIYTSPWLNAKGREIDILATLEENYEKGPPLDQFLDTRLEKCLELNFTNSIQFQEGLKLKLMSS